MDPGTTDGLSLPVYKWAVSQLFHGENNKNVGITFNADGAFLKIARSIYAGNIWKPNNKKDSQKVKNNKSGQ